MTATAPANPHEPRPALWRWVLGVFAPPLAATSLHWWLSTEAESFSPAFPLKEVRTVTSWTDVVLPWLLGLLAVAVGIALLVWLRRRLGWARLGRPLLAAWWLLCAAGAWAVWAAHTDRAGMVPGPELQARVLGVGDKAPSQHGPGGAMVFLQSPAWPGPRSVLLEGAPAGSVAPGSVLGLKTGQGARGGAYVTAWSVAEAPPASTTAAASAPAQAASAPAAR